MASEQQAVLGRTTAGCADLVMDRITHEGSINQAHWNGYSSPSEARHMKARLAKEELMEEAKVLNTRQQHGQQPVLRSYRPEVSPRNSITVHFPIFVLIFVRVEQGHRSLFVTRQNPRSNCLGEQSSGEEQRIRPLTARHHQCDMGVNTDVEHYQGASASL